MTELDNLTQEELVSMVQSLESQLRDLYLEKRLSGLDRDQLVSMIGSLEQQHDEMVTSLSEQLADLYSNVDHQEIGGQIGVSKEDEFQRLRVAAGRR